MSGTQVNEPCETHGVAKRPTGSRRVHIWVPDPDLGIFSMTLAQKLTEGRLSSG
jgi:hypothetical protein